MGGMIDLSYPEIYSTLEVHCFQQRLTVAKVQLLSAGKDLQIILTVQLHIWSAIILTVNCYRICNVMPIFTKSSSEIENKWSEILDLHQVDLLDHLFHRFVSHESRH